ncbi:uncharacterized mitochondrial protein AtMg00810-like [Carya illinoinensis]|uniref:uncharacterized mitochondrial protein AtMg00810-like n=1 Tax=Carya illinoinensis TaxID=32201 RepID=UPI001C71BCBE|nr:uncharacterized mitochondrial protein AtMg00810-like [Carya illinoinensis]
MTHNSDGLTLSQAKYELEILDLAQMKHCKPMGTPMMSKKKGLASDVPFPDPSYYWSIVGALQYLTLTRLDLAFTVNFASQFLQFPSKANYKMIGQVVICRSTTGYCIFLGRNCIFEFAKEKNTISQSSSKAEYRAMWSTTAEITWISFLARDLGVTLP